MNAQFEAISRKAATSELSAIELDWLETYLREHPEKRLDLDWDQAFSRKLEEKIAAMPTMPGWERTEQAMRAEQSELQGSASRSRISDQQSVGILDRFAHWLSTMLGFRLNTQAIAVALVFVQAGVIGLMATQNRDPQYSETRAGVLDAAARGPMLRVSFRQDIREADLRRVLADVGGEIVGGPGQLGVYLVRIKDGDLTVAAQRLRASGTTELVEPVAVKP